MWTRPTNNVDDDDNFVFATSAASNELSIRSNNAVSLFWKLRFHDRQNPWPSTLVNNEDGGGGRAVAASVDVDAEDDDGEGWDDGVCVLFTTRYFDGDGIVAKNGTTVTAYVGVSQLKLVSLSRLSRLRQRSPLKQNSFLPCIGNRCVD